MNDPLRTLKHDLRTPVNHIVGYCELLLEEGGTDGGDRYVADLERIHGAGRRLLGLINDVLDIRKLQAGEVDVAWIRHELRTPLNQIIGYGELLQEEAEDDGRVEMVPDLRRITEAARNLADLIAARLATLESAEDPRPASVAAPPQAADPPSAAPSRPHHDVRPGSLLVVDDDELNRDMLSRRLEREGHQVMGVENGRQALEVVRSHPFDLVLLDILMPEMDGHATLEHLKADPESRDIPVIMLSALDDMDGVARCIEAGAEDYLPKPFDPVLLRARIGAGLEKKFLRDQEVEYLRQVAAVTGAAAAVEAGQFDPDSLGDVAARSDALGQLARVFQRMAREVYAREQRLKQEVRQLRIEIDQTKKAREVAEITESDYFQQLQRKARDLRNAKDH